MSGRLINRTEAERLLKAGVSLAEIARIYGVSRQAAQQWADVISSRKERMAYRNKAAKERAKQIDAMLEDGMSLREIAQEMEITYNWLWNFCASHGVKVKRRKP